MANALYRKMPDGQWINQANPGGPHLFKVAVQPDDGLWYSYFTWDAINWVRFIPSGAGDTTPAAAQVKLDNYVGQLNAGTA